MHAADTSISQDKGVQWDKRSSWDEALLHAWYWSSKPLVPKLALSLFSSSSTLVSSRLPSWSILPHSACYTFVFPIVYPFHMWFWVPHSLKYISRTYIPSPDFFNHRSSMTNLNFSFSLWLACFFLLSISFIFLFKQYFSSVHSMPEIVYMRNGT